MTKGEQAWYLPAHAKINLGLRVVGRRADGYHEIDSWMHAIAFHDDLWVTASSVDDQDPVSVEISSDEEVGGLQVAAGPDNLVAVAAKRFLETAGLSSHVALRYALHKRVPAGGGLGGGSADAAAALRLANVACGEPLTIHQLHRIASTLGADVPFFLAGGTQRARGIGDQLEPVRGTDAPRLEIVLVLPRRGTSTVDVYRALEIPSRPSAAALGVVVPADEDGPWWHNDLEDTAIGLDPELGAIRDRARELGADTIRMSGSGSTFFAVCPSRTARDLTRQALAPLRAEFGARVLATRSSPLFGPPRRTGWREVPREVGGFGGEGSSPEGTGEGRSEGGVQ